MRVLRVLEQKNRVLALGFFVAFGATSFPALALDKPTGAPLEISSIETEQPIPLVYLDPDGHTAHCSAIKLHWDPNPNVGPKDDATSFTIDLAPENPGAAVFTSQLWNASLASALAWQQPWQGARWKVFQVPVTDGTGIDAALAVGMISTSARRPYPDKTAVIGSLNPDGSLGPVSHLVERMDAAAAAGITRVIIPNVQKFDTDSTGQVVNMVRHAGGLHLDCVPVDNLVEATETVMNDPLPDLASDATAPRYGNDITSYIDDFAHREQNEADINLKYAPKETELAHFPPRQAALWKSVYADYAAAQQAYRGGQVYVAYRLFSRANATMIGVNTLVGQNRASFDVKTALAESDDLRNHLQALMNPPAIDQGELESAVLVAEMADWAYDLNASLEGAQLVTKQTFSQRSDATEEEKDRARETILFAIEQSKRLMNQAAFFNGLLPHVGQNPLPVDDNAAHLLPQLIPAQLATARIFSDGIRERANDLGSGLLFDPRLVAYVNVLRQEKTDWDARQRKKEAEAAAAAAQAAATPVAGPPNSTNQVVTPVKLNDNAATGAVAFDPGNTYMPPHTAVSPTLPTRKLSDVALCLIWANTDCEIATLDEKYLRLSGTVDPVSHEWHVKDRAKLDALVQSAESGARQGIAFAEKAEVNSAVLAMIYERAAHLRIQDDDASALDALRLYWRCALLGNMCWQLAHTRKAQPVDLSAEGDKPAEKSAPAKTQATNSNVNATKAAADAATAKLLGTPNPPAPSVAAHSATTSNPPVVPVASHPYPAPSPKVEDVINPPVVPIAHDTEYKAPPRALPVTDDTIPTPAPVPVPAPPRALPVTDDVTPAPAPIPKPVVTPPATDDSGIPVAPIAKVQDYSGGDTSPATNTPPPSAPPKNDNADAHGGF